MNMKHSIWSEWISVTCMFVGMFMITFAWVLLPWTQYYGKIKSGYANNSKISELELPIPETVNASLLCGSPNNNYGFEKLITPIKTTYTTSTKHTSQHVAYPEFLVLFLVIIFVLVATVCISHSKVALTSAPFVMFWAMLLFFLFVITVCAAYPTIPKQNFLKYQKQPSMICNKQLAEFTQVDSYKLASGYIVFCVGTVLIVTGAVVYGIQKNVFTKVFNQTDLL